MLQFFADFLPFHIIAALLGLLLGWLLWRWRRGKIDGAHYQRLVKAEGSYKSEIDTLTTQRSRLQADFDGQKSTIAGLESEVSQLGDLRVKSDALRVDYHEAVSARTQLQANYDSAEESRLQLESNLAASEGSRGELQTNLQASEKARGQLQVSLEQSEEARQELQAKVEASAAARAELQANLEAAEQDLGRLSGELSAAQSANVQLKSDFDASSSRLASLESDDGEMSVLKASLASATAGLAAGKLMSSDLEGKVEALEGDLGLTRQKIVDLEGQLADADAQRSDIEGSKTEAEELSGVLRGQLGTANDRIAALEAEAAAAAEAASAQAQSLQGEWDSSSAQVQSLQGQLGGANNRISELEAAAAAAAAAAASQVQSLQGDYDTSSGQVEALQGELGTANGRISELEAAAAAAAADAASQVQSLQGDYDTSSGQVEALRGQLGTANGRISELEKAAQAQGKALQSETDASKSARTDLAATQAELKTATARISELEKANAEIAKLRGELDTTGKAKSAADANVVDLTAKLKAARELEAQLKAANARIAELEKANAEIAKLRGELDTAGKAKTAADANVVDLTAKLKAARELEAQIKAANARIAELERINAEIAKLRGQLDAAHRAATVANDGLKKSEQSLAQSQARVGGLNDDVGRGTARIRELEALLAEARKPKPAPKPAPVAKAAPVTSLADLNAGGWKQGTTKLGLPGANHKDDLKVVSGIGPKMEGLLNSFGIKSWEQLAAFSKADVATVDAALEDFPGRIERDEWVEQAREIIKNGHKPVDRAPKPRPAAKPAAKAAPATTLAGLNAGGWKQGTTKLGLPGANHKDDLKEVSGIGPKMETLLNSFGIKSWEQLAAFSKADVGTVDAALEDFPGRIERDEWVEQARDFIKNGHKPTERAPKARPAPSWQKGTTKLGTPGAGHSDDLKVVNGIGPKMEGILKDFGIKTWEQLAAFTKADVTKVNEAINTFPGRIERDEWVAQAKDLVKRFPLSSPYNRPTRETFLNNSDS